MSEVPNRRSAAAGTWLWDGYLAPGNITLLTSRWKAGKTTLLTGLLQRLERGEPFLGRAVTAGKALVVSEESTDHWAERLRQMPVGPHVQLLSRPFAGRPTWDEWIALIDDACRMRRDGELDLFVIDPMAMFVPGAWESNPALLVDALAPVHRLTATGAAGLLLHHPRKTRSEPGESARGTGALLGFVDVALELFRHGRRGDRRRELVSLARSARAPERLVYEWGPDGAFAAVADPGWAVFEQNWAQVLGLLKGRTAPATHHELLADWPADQERPSASVLYEWLNRAFAEDRVRRVGKGTRLDPWRYRLPNEDDEYYARGELPPLRVNLSPLPGMGRGR
jgi:hypothetical protein